MNESVAVTERDCPECDGKVELLENLGVWLCSEDADHAWPEGDL